MNHNWNADQLLRYFDTPIRLYLYGRILDLTNIKTNYRNVRGADSKGKRHRLHKKNILFACPPDVKPYIKMDTSIKNLELKPEDLIENSFRVDEGELESVIGGNIVLVTRGGHIIRGELQAFDKYHLFMRVDNKVVLVYRHGLSDFKKEKVPNQIKTNDLRELRKEKHQEWVEPSQETVLRTEDNDRNEVRKKKHLERVEANHPKKEKVPSQTKTSDLRKLEKNEKVQKTTLKKRKFRQGDEHIPSDYTAITAHNEKRLGTDTASRKTQVSMYSDSTHFVYEILQNADDHGATEVCFKLSENEIVIEHNGELFTKENVEAITYFGKSTSRDDLVKTGRFGVGFKSVFAFTATPIIISGDEHFQIYGLYRIREYPYPDGFSRSWTRIVLPFNHESEQPDFVEKLMRREEAYTQISECLTTLNMDTLLFTQNIREIRWEIDNRSVRYRREDEIENNVRFTTITSGKHANKYVVFSKTPKWENQEYKAVEIAFAVDTLGQLSPIDNDSLYVLFRTEEKTGLKFILNGPYRTNPARETISKTDDFNLHLMKVTCELMKESLPYLRDRNLLTVEFLSILPNQEDILPDFYTPPRDTIISEFRNEKLTPMKEGGHAAASGIYRGESQLSSLIQDEDLTRLLGKDKSSPLWVAEPQISRKRNERGQFISDINAQRQNERISNFLTMLNISEWETENLVMVLDTQSDMIIDWLWEKSNEWHQALYVLLSSFLSSVPSYPLYIGRERKDKLLPLRIVRCDDGNYRAGGQCHFSSDDIEHDENLLNVVTGVEEENQRQIQKEDGHEEDFHYVAKGIYPSGRNQDEEVRKFLEIIGVREVDETERIKMILKQRYMSESFKPHETDLDRFIKLVETDPSKAELFKSYSIFEVDLERDNTRWFYKPSSVFVDSPYLDTGLTAYYEVIEEGSKHFRRPLSPKYVKSDIDPKQLGEFAEAVGAETKLQIFEHEIPHDHPEWDWLMSAPGTLFTYTGTNEDYSIPEFEDLFYEPSIDKAKLIWRTMCSAPEHYLEARFRRNQSNEPHEAHSSLVHCLKKTKWVPQQKDDDSISFVLPRKASIECLPKGFPYEPTQKWLQAIEFGKAAREQKAEHIQWNQKAKDLGFNSGDDAEKWAGFARDLKEKGISIDDVKSKFSFQNSETNPDFPTAPARNQERRAKLIAEQLRNTPEKAEVPDVNVQIRRREIDRHTGLRDLYTNDLGEMTCQICEEKMPFKKRDGEYYFEAVEILTSHYFPKEHEAQLLALCPECAARYKYFVIGDISAMEALKKQLMSSNNLKVSVQLGELETSIRFVETHLLDLKTVLHCYSIQYRRFDQLSRRTL